MITKAPMTFASVITTATRFSINARINVNFTHRASWKLELQVSDTSVGCSGSIHTGKLIIDG